MRSFEHEQDPATLREAVRLLERENERLHARLAELVAELAQLKGQSAPEQLTLELAQLKEQLDQLQKQLYGASSERRPREDKAPAEAPRKRSGHGPTRQEALPVQEVRIELAEDARGCAECGGTMEAIARATEDSELITVIERQFLVQKIRRQKYGCTCGVGLLTAPAPRRPVPGGRYSLAFAVHVATQKYLEHQPLDRQRRAMRRLGLQVTTQTLWDQIDALARLWAPVTELIRDYILGDDVVGMDETRWRLLSKKENPRWWVWSLTCANAVFYRIAPSRSAQLASEILGDFRGTIVCDGYRVYESLAKNHKHLRLALCWSHARRKFVDAVSNYPECATALELIGDLFAIDRATDNPALLGGEAKRLAAEARQRARREQAPPLLEKLRTWALAQRGLPKSSLRKAIDYLLGHWKGLTVFLEDPFVPLDNNHTERSLRTVVLGRKNHYGSRSQRGTEVAAIFYTMLETAALQGLDPARYLLSASQALLDGAPPEAVLPFAAPAT